jgi:hypothetical protein
VTSAQIDTGGPTRYAGPTPGETEHHGLQVTALRRIELRARMTRFGRSLPSAGIGHCPKAAFDPLLPIASVRFRAA